MGCDANCVLGGGRSRTDDLNQDGHLVRPPSLDSSDHQDYETCLVGDSELNLHFPLLQGGGHIQDGLFFFFGGGGGV